MAQAARDRTITPAAELFAESCLEEATTVHRPVQRPGYLLPVHIEGVCRGKYSRSQESASTGCKCLRTSQRNRRIRIVGSDARAALADDEKRVVSLISAQFTVFDLGRTR